MNKLRTLKPRLAKLPDAIQVGDSWRVGKGSTARGYGYEWQQARLEHLQREPLCRMCKAQGLVTLATVVDHIRPHNGNQELFWDRSNWQSLCARCHSKWKQRQERNQGATRTRGPKG